MNRLRVQGIKVPNYISEAGGRFKIDLLQVHNRRVDRAHLVTKLVARGGKLRVAIYHNTKYSDDNAIVFGDERRGGFGINAFFDLKEGFNQAPRKVSGFTLDNTDAYDAPPAMKLHEFMEQHPLFKRFTGPEIYHIGDVENEFRKTLHRMSFKIEVLEDMIDYTYGCDISRLWKMIQDEFASLVKAYPRGVSI